MRLSAYKKALGEANKLPNNIPELKLYFNNNYSPRTEAMWKILNMARADINALFPSEFIEVHEKYDELTRAGLNKKKVVEPK